MEQRRRASPRGAFGRIVEPAVGDDDDRRGVLLRTHRASARSAAREIAPSRERAAVWRRAAAGAPSPKPSTVSGALLRVAARARRSRCRARRARLRGRPAAPSSATRRRARPRAHRRRSRCAGTRTGRRIDTSSAASASIPVATTRRPPRSRRRSSTSSSTKLAAASASATHTAHRGRSAWVARCVDGVEVARGEVGARIGCRPSMLSSTRANPAAQSDSGARGRPRRGAPPRAARAGARVR